jgi:two-component system, OmpR family, alkaline phosphatase synthesis response regulator PhoP
MKPASILITDDEANIRMMLRTALEADGHRVSEASNGREALARIADDAPDLVVLDLNMPVMDGMAVLEQLQAMSPEDKPRVMILTAYGSIPAAVKATRLGAVDFLEKPLTPSELRQSVRSILDEPELDSPPAGADAAGGYEQVLHLIRRSMRNADFSSAESLLSEAANAREQQSAQYFNLLGVLYEAQRKWRLARKCYGKAIAADKKYEPSQLNMRRLYELQSFGRSTQSVMLGGELSESAIPFRVVND